jgi:hypothetical protein
MRYLRPHRGDQQGGGIDLFWDIDDVNVEA